MTDTSNVNELARIAVLGLVLLALIPLNLPSAFEGQPAEKAISLEPLPVAPGAQFSLLGFTIKAPWMSGSLQMRMPETLSSSMGLHFIDHNRPDMPPLGAISPEPVWHKDAITGELSYETRTAEGLIFGGRATPDGPRVQMAFWVRNETGQQLNFVSNQQCLVLNREPEFGRQNTLDTTYSWVGGKWQCLNATTPTPVEKGRNPWILMPVAGGPPDLGGQKELPSGWWVVNEVADAYLIARQSEDGKHLIAVSWDDQPPGLLMTNTWIPCLHAGPMNAPNLAPGASHTWRGVLYLMENDPDRLKQLFDEDWAAFRARKVSP